MTDLELELRDLAAHLDVPPAPPLLGVVLARLVRRRRRRRVLVFAVAIGITALAVAFAVPGSRASLLRFFHLRGAAVTLVDRLPPTQRRGPLGVSRSRSTARHSACSCQAGVALSRSTPATAATGFATPACSCSSSRAVPGSEILKKAAVGTTDVEYVDVDGEPGIWIGGRHAVYLPGGPPRAAGHALIWKHGRLTLRLEAAVGRERALAIARSVR